MNCGRFRWSTFASTVPLTPPTPGPSRTANRRASRRKSADRHPAGRAPAGDRRAPTGGPRPRRVEAVVGGIGPADALCEVAPGVHARCDRSTVRPPIVRVSTRSPSQTPCRATDEAAWTPRIALPAVGRRWLDAPCAAALRISSWTPSATGDVHEPHADVDVQAHRSPLLDPPAPPWSPTACPVEPRRPSPPPCRREVGCSSAHPPHTVRAGAEARTEGERTVSRPAGRC
jgi:hypothetical protein